MPRLTLWNSGRRGNDYHYFDKTISNFMEMSGTALYVHLYLGVFDQDKTDGSVKDGGVMSVQDVLFLENRDRKYSDVVYELPGTYNVQDIDFDLKQFGFFLQNDTLFVTIHYNDMLAKCGRKIVAGDVIELPHRRDDAMGVEGVAVNRYYVVDDATFSSEGYSSTWYAHLWRLKLIPMTAGQEYKDILDQQAKDPFGFDQGTLGDIISTIGKDMEINDAIVEEAKKSMLLRNFETRQFWVVPGEGGADGASNPWIFAGDGHPPNGATLIGSGNSFPDASTVQEGDYFLRTDWEPHTLFMRVGSSWRIQEVDLRNEWEAAHRLLADFLRNENITTFTDGDTMAEKQALSKAVKPKADF